jgi:acetolactate synthase I/II/III large subunit
MTAVTGLEGGSIVCRTLAALGARHVFGLPGTQSTSLYEALRRSGLKAIVPTHELAAAFMAGAYFRACGTPGVLTTIPGPGLAYALAGLAEARLDSAAVLYILNAPGSSSRIGYGPQAIDQCALLAPVTKAVIRVSQMSEIAAAVERAWSFALAGEPGPVALELSEEASDADLMASAPAHAPSGDAAIAAACQDIASARRPLLLAGQGALSSAREIDALSKRWAAPVLTTPSARGIVPESSALAMGFDVLRGTTDAANRLIEEADLVLAIGAKLAHNGSAGGRLVLPTDKLIRVDQSGEALSAVYPAAHALEMSAADFLARPELQRVSRSAWSDDDIAGHRASIRMLSAANEPGICGGTPAEFFASLDGGMTPATRLVTDTGMHQVMARRHLDVAAPGGLLIPSDFQSMGFGLPAAIAACLADPKRPVVALIGDGGLRMMGFEIATAVREGLALTVVVLNDGCLNQIRLQQLAEHGVVSGTELGPLDLRAFADTVGAEYALGDTVENFASSMSSASASGGVTLIEVPVGDTQAIRGTALKARAKRIARQALGDRLSGVVKILRR